MAGASAWERLWTPHRIAYIKGENRPPHTQAGDDCPFCRVPGLPDDEALIIACSLADAYRDDGYDEGFFSVGLGVRWRPGK